MFFVVTLLLKFIIQLRFPRSSSTLNEVEEVMIPTDCVKRKLDGVVDSVLFDKGCEVFDRELTHDKWD